MGKKKQKKFDDTQSEISSINGSTSTYQSTAGGKEGELYNMKLQVYNLVVFAHFYRPNYAPLELFL